MEAMVVKAVVMMEAAVESAAMEAAVESAGMEAAVESAAMNSAVKPAMPSTGGSWRGQREQ